MHGSHSFPPPPAWSSLDAGTELFQGQIALTERGF
jgi:hypothetical protein